MRKRLVLHLGDVLPCDPVYDHFSDMGVSGYYAAEGHEDDHDNGDYYYHHLFGACLGGARTSRELWILKYG